MFEQDIKDAPDSERRFNNVWNELSDWETINRLL